MQRVIGYCRVSTEHQASDGVSLGMQESRIQAWALANGYEVAGIHVDAGLSGKRADNRPALQAAVKEACECGGVLVVYSLSRLARSTKDTIVIGERLDKAGADLVSLSERIDTTNAAGKMVFRMLAVMAEFERDLASERTTAALSHKRSKSERTGTVPVGYDLADDGVTLITNEREQQAITIVASLRQQGLSLRKIADELNRQGIPSKNGKPWKHSTVQRIVDRLAA